MIVLILFGAGSGDSRWGEFGGQNTELAANCEKIFCNQKCEVFVEFQQHLY